MNAKTSIRADLIPLDDIDKAVLEQHYPGAVTGAAWEVSVHGDGMSATTLGQALGAITRGWLEHVHDAAGNKLTEEQKERLVPQIIAAMAIALELGIKTAGGTRQ